MKLESVNGTYDPLTMKVGAKEDGKSDEMNGGAAESVDEGMEEGEQLYEGGGNAEKEAGGKKKGARKKRSLNWEEAERGLLLEVIKSKVDFVENRNVDAKSVKAKRLAWMQITKQFNALNFRHRSLEQIQVQWRSMKNTAKREYLQKHPKNGPIEGGMDMIEFMEELQKDPVSVRSQTRGGTAASAAAAAAAAAALAATTEGAAAASGDNLEEEAPLKRAGGHDLDDEDTPLASLPTSANNSEDTQQSSTAVLPSPPPSADSQNDTQQAAPPVRARKKCGPKPHANATGKTKRQRMQIHTPTESATIGAASVVDSSASSPHNLASASAIGHSIAAATNGGNACVPAGAAAGLPTTPTLCGGGGGGNGGGDEADDKYKKQIFDLMKRARLAQMDYARREHEQKLRFEQLEQDLKLRQLREEHDIRMRHYKAEHEARMRVYASNGMPENAPPKCETVEKDAAAAV